MSNPARKLALMARMKEPRYQSLFDRLNAEEEGTLWRFLDKNGTLGHLEFEYAVNRMYLDREKSKNFGIVQELLLAANTLVHLKPRGERS